VAAGEGPGAVARLYAGAGIRVLPIKPGTKRPPLNGWQKIATTDPAVIDEWWGNGYADCGVGLAMGLQPDGRRLFALDVDRHDPAADGYETLAALQHIAGDLPDTVGALTGNGGMHLIFDSGAQLVTNGAANQLGPGLDVRGEGGQIVVYPSVHPNGTAYQWEDGYAPWEHEIALAPAWLLKLLLPPAPATPPWGARNPAPRTRARVPLPRARRPGIHPPTSSARGGTGSPSSPHEAGSSTQPAADPTTPPGHAPAKTRDTAPQPSSTVRTARSSCSPPTHKPAPCGPPAKCQQTAPASR
jgi:hypothetical protein